MEFEYAVVINIKEERLVKTIYAIGKETAKKKVIEKLILDKEYSEEEIKHASKKAYAYIV